MRSRDSDAVPRIRPQTRAVRPDARIPRVEIASHPKLATIRPTNCPNPQKKGKKKRGRKDSLKRDTSRRSKIIAVQIRGIGSTEIKPHTAVHHPRNSRRRRRDRLARPRRRRGRGGAHGRPARRRRRGLGRPAAIPRQRDGRPRVRGHGVRRHAHVVIAREPRAVGPAQRRVPAAQGRLRDPRRRRDRPARVVRRHQPEARAIRREAALGGPGAPAARGCGCGLGARAGRAGRGDAVVGVEAQIAAVGADAGVPGDEIWVEGGVGLAG